MLCQIRLDILIKSENTASAEPCRARVIDGKPLHLDMFLTVGDRSPRMTSLRPACDRVGPCVQRGDGRSRTASHHLGPDEFCTFLEPIQTERRHVRIRRLVQDHFRHKQPCTRPQTKAMPAEPGRHDQAGQTLYR
jgi:hypothetical protein